MDENYISLERAIERMYEVTEECGTERIFIDRIVDELENLPSSPNICIHPQRIPVSERLPESEKDPVLIALKWGSVDIGWCENEVWGSEFVIEYGNGEVTHWIPLPEPPKGG